MPTAPKTLCPGCQRKIVEQGQRCPACADKHRKRPSVRRSGDPFYNSAPWRRVRAERLSLNPLCQDCQDVGRVTAATEVHHVKPRADYPELELDIDNTRSCCKRHHSGHTMREMHEKRKHRPPGG
jgi:5-methylcytosine-specific restriction protein A